MKVLFYGITGFTGELIVAEAAKKGLKPILAGRNDAKVRALAGRYGMEFRVFGLDDAKELDYALADVDLVLHCAGPFQFTTEPMVQACLRNMVHYLDISGRIEGFEYAQSLNYEALKQQILLLPGVGFDVVPSDCLVAHLKRQLPDATHLTLAVAMKNGGVSHGTALSAVENLGQSGKIRQNGTIISIPMAYKKQKFDFGGWYQSVGVTVPWGDVSTAFYTAGIPNVEVYMAVSDGSAQFMEFSNKINWLLQSEMVKKIARNIIESRPAGPNARQRQKSESYFWGEVRNSQGTTKRAALKVSEAYTHTAQAAVHIVKKLSDGKIKSGFQTPAGLFGENLVLEIKGSELKPLR